MESRPETGLLGIGLLGSALAERLLAVGGLRGFDLDGGQRRAFADLGGTIAEDAAEVVEHVEILFLSLPTSDTVATLLEQLDPHFRPGQIVVDTSTGDPAQMIAIGESLARRGVEYVEALVAGSSVQVRAGQVTLFVGGAEDAVAGVDALLDAISNQRFHLGPVGAASRFKLVHNLVLGLHRAVLAEGLTFAESLGIDPAVALRILSQTPAASTVMQTKGNAMVTREFPPQARLSQHLKDVRLILAEAAAHDCRTPLSELHAELLQQAEALGFGDADNSAIIEAFQSLGPTGHE